MNRNGTRQEAMGSIVPALAVNRSLVKFNVDKRGRELEKVYIQVTGSIWQEFLATLTYPLLALSAASHRMSLLAACGNVISLPRAA